MIGRVGVTAPWIFAAMRNLAETGSYRMEIDLFDVYASVMNDIKNMLPENLHKSRAHRFSFYYMKNFTFAHDLMKKIRNLDRIEMMVDTLADYLNRNPHERVKIYSGGCSNGTHEGLERDQC